jgi:hypothetical protein
MGKIWMPGGGGGADLDVITAGAGDVLAGKVGVDKDGNPVTGTMPDCRKPTKIRYWRYNNNRFEVAVDYGLHGSSWADNYYEYLELGDIGLEPWKFRSDTNICGVQGGIPMQGADVSGTDRVWATNMSNWAGTINLGVRNGHFLNGVNWIQQDIPNYQPWNIKKGVNIGGVVGTWEGYVPGATDLYYRGNNVAGWTGTQGSLFFEAGQITLKSYSCRIAATFSTVGRNYINIEGYRDALNSGTLTVSYLSGGTYEDVGSLMYLPNGNYVHSISVAARQANTTFRILFEGMQPAIYRIWLS